VARRRDDDVGRPLDPGSLEHVELGPVAVETAVLELLLERVEADRVLLDDHDLVPEPVQRAGQVRSDLPSADDHDGHQRPSPSTDAVSASMAVRVGETISKPRPA